MTASVQTVTAPDGGSLRVELDGEGPPLVLTHGSFTDRSAFRRVRPLVGEGRRLVLPVLRGHEDTATPLPSGFGITTTEVTDLLAVLDAVGIERASFLAHSTSGAVALALAMAHPDRVDRLVLIEPSVFGFLDAATMAQVSSDAAPTIAAGDRGDHDAAARGFLAFIAPDVWAGLDPTMQDRMASAIAPLGALIAPHVRSLLSWEVSADDLARLTAPTVLIYGGASLPFEAEISARFAELRPDIEQVLVPGAGHNVHVEQPAAVAEVVERFIPR